MGDHAARTIPKTARASPRAAMEPLRNRVPALLVNQSFLDVLDHLRQPLADLGFDVVNGPDFAASEPVHRRRLLATVAVVFGPGPLTREDMDQATCLKVISLASSGYESVDVDAATERGIVVTNAPTALGTESVADLTFGLIIDAARGISRSNQLLRTGVWRRPMGVTVWNKTLGIIGLGRIGRAVARRARGFDMTVLALPHHAADPLALDGGLEAVPMEELLRRSDFVSLHSRYAPESHHLIGRAQLRMMKPTAHLINTSRTGIVDPAALAEALADGWIAGAGLDVFDGEPDPRSPFVALPNVVATPHIGNRTVEGVLDVVECSIANALAVLHGHRPEFVVNPAVYERGAR